MEKCALILCIYFMFPFLFIKPIIQTHINTNININLSYKLFKINILNKPLPFLPKLLTNLHPTFHLLPIFNPLLK